MQLQSPIFIVGPGRSGTTLVRSLLSAHSRIAVTPETQFLGWVNQRENVEGEPQNFESFWEEYTAWVRFQDLDVDAEHCRALIEQAGNYTFETIFRAVLTAYGERMGVARVGEKSPSHVHYLSLLLDWFPDGRVLLMKRDPRAVIASQLQTPYVQDRVTPRSVRSGLLTHKRLGQILHFADEWMDIYQHVLPRWQKDARVETVSYERLVQDTMPELQRVCRFLDEAYEPTMITDRSPRAVQMPAGTTPNERLEHWRRRHHKKSLGRITPDSLDKWKTNLSTMEVAIIEDRCLNGMRGCGYALTTSVYQRLKGKMASHVFSALERGEQVARRVVSKVRRRLH